MNLIDHMIEKSNSLTNQDDLKGLIQKGISFEQLPLRPLYIILKRSTPADCSEFLEKMNADQRQAFLDIDLWKKDDLDIEAFSFWPLAYGRASQSLRFEFAKSSNFALFLKGRFNIWTFDEEDPIYPNHDNYFLTEDHFLLFEYEEGCEYIDEIRQLIKDLYSDLGVENAYAHLFKIVSDSYLPMLEEEYQTKNDRLLFYGFVNFYDALEITAPYPDLSTMNKAMAVKRTIAANLPDISLAQSLHYSDLNIFKEGLDPLEEDLSQNQNVERQNFLRFNLVKLINATLILEDSSHHHTMATQKSSKQVKSYILLGFNYLKKHTIFHKDKSVFERFDFFDVYRYGKTLIFTQQSVLKKSLKASLFKEDPSFLGPYWVDFIDYSLQPPSFTTFEDYTFWSHQIQTLIHLLPFAEKLAKVFNKMKSSGSICNDFYLNYNVNEIDLEAILLSSLANFFLGQYGQGPTNKIGLSLKEFKVFALRFTSSDGHKNNKKIIAKFLQSFGLHRISHIEDYILSIGKNHLDGQNFLELQDRDYQYVGGPIILNHTHSNN